MLRRSECALPCVALVVAMFAASGAFAEEEIRIAVARAQSPVALSGSELRAEDVLTADVLSKGRRTLVVGAGERGLTLEGKPVKSHRLIVTGRDGVSYQGRNFNGRIEVLWQKAKGRAQVLLVHPLPIERYLVGILAGEIPPSWPIEAMKAQAVAARTYAIYQKFHAPDRPYHLDSGVLDQVYGGTQHETAAARNAVAATAGEVLTFHRRPIRAYFHACCADRTEGAKDGWGTSEPYLQSVSCGFCKDCGRYRWTLKVPLAELTKRLDGRNLSVGVVKDLTVIKTTATGRAAELKVEGSKRHRQLHAEDLRRILGYEQLRSRMFTVRKDGAQLVFEGKGSGHGVGLCQWGSRGMALKGSAYRAILGHYYPGSRIQRMY